MSSGERLTAQRASVIRGRQAGLTAIEMMIALVMLAAMSLVVERTLNATRQAERQLGGIRLVIERGQRLGYQIHKTVGASRKLFQDDAIGLGYMAALDLDGAKPPVENLRLPRFDEERGLGPDLPGDPRTGNAVLFVREADAAPTVSDPATGKLRYVDTYRFVCIYVAQTDRRLVEEPGRPTALDLVFWRSIAFASYGQLMNISDPAERANVITDLQDRFGYEYCWDAQKPVDEAFFALGAGGTVDPLPVEAFTIELDRDLSERGKLVYANLQLARTDPVSTPRRALFTVDDPALWVPDGFEVKIVGASGARKVWTRLVIETQSSKGRVAAHASTVITSTKDM